MSRRLSRAALIAVLFVIVLAPVALAHVAASRQTFRDGAKLSAFSGTFEVVWPVRVLADGAEIELRSSVAGALRRDEGNTALEWPYPCPFAAVASSCSRLRLESIPPLAVGAYAIYLRVVHEDGFIEQRLVRFTVEPSAPSASPSADATAPPPPQPPSEPPTPTPTTSLDASTQPADSPPASQTLESTVAASAHNEGQMGEILAPALVSLVLIAAMWRGLRRKRR